MKAESVFRLRVIKFLRTLHFCKIFSIQQKAITGHPDIILCLDGLFVGIEIKTDIGKPSPRQILTLEEVIKAKGAALIVRPNNFEGVKERLLKLSRGIRYGNNEIQGIIAPTTSNGIGESRKHTDESNKKLRSEQTSIGCKEGVRESSGGEYCDSEEFREI